MYAYSSTGHYTSAFQTFDLFVVGEAPEATWSEEFNYNGAVDSNTWTHEIGNGEWGWGNGEFQYYTSSLNNVKVEDGVLKITAKREDMAGYEYTSARIISRDKFEFQYGRVDIRAKLPTGGGTWPALWLLGANFNEVGWPACGEIDIMEHWGHDPTVIAGSIHTPMSHGDTWTHGYTTVNDYHEEFHIYSIDWDENRIQFFVDDVLYYTYSPSPQDSDSWPFDQEMFFILNVAMGGHWFDVDPQFNESTMEVDYIRIDIENKDGSLIRTFTNNKDKHSKIENNDVNKMVGNPVLSNPNDIDNALSSDNLVSLSTRSGGNRLIWDMRLSLIHI